MLWVFILADMFLFGAYFLIFLAVRSSEPGVFTQGAAELNATVGMANTLVLLTSSLLVVWGLDAARRQRFDWSVWMYGAAIGCGVLFGIIKYFEWRQKIESGLLLTTNDFFMFYYAYTGMHMIHVIIGTTVLWLIVIKLRQRESRDADMRFYEGGSIYWHLVDLLWVVLFPLFYLTT